MNLLRKIQNASLYPLAYSIVSAQSFSARVNAFGKKPVVLFERPYEGQKILLLALYEKGVLRSDIENLLITAKALGMYILAVNTQKVKEPDRLKDKIDCYIERPNFGRDFGSYKTGFLHLYKHSWERRCDRLLLLNDSLFYSKTNLKPFLEQMITTELDALGATENFEIEHHLGSFCISLNQHILKHRHFKRYWVRYSNTDIRPTVIKRGEMKLSKTLKRCVSSNDQFAALFNLTWLFEQLEKNNNIIHTPDNIYRVADYYRLIKEGELLEWKRPSLKSVAKRLIQKYSISDLSLISEENDELDLKIENYNRHFINGVDGLTEFLKLTLKDSNADSLKERVLDEIKNDIFEAFTAGSQIHLNNILLHRLGMPLIKLDGLYRGAFSVVDIEKIAHQLQIGEREEFIRIMLSKPFGGDTLRGWRSAAFYRNGLI